MKPPGEHCWVYRMASEHIGSLPKVKEEYLPQFLKEFQDKLFFDTNMLGYDFSAPMAKLLINWHDSGKINMINEIMLKKISREKAIKLLVL